MELRNAWTGERKRLLVGTVTGNELKKKKNNVKKGNEGSRVPQKSEKQVGDWK